MPHLSTDDGIKLYYEEVGSGHPIVFVHEFAGDFRSYKSGCAISDSAIAASLTMPRLFAVRRSARAREIFAGRGRKKSQRA